MIFRLTQKVSNKLRIPCEELAQSSASILEWYCNLVVAQRRQFFLFTQAATLFSFWASAAGYSRGEFSPMFRRRATDALRDYGFSDDDVATLIDDGPMSSPGVWIEGLLDRWSTMQRCSDTLWTTRVALSAWVHAV